MRNTSQLAALSLLLLGAGSLHAQSFSYADFSSTAGLQLNGNAAQNGNKLRLTQASGNQGGSTFSTSLITLNPNASFSTFFAFEILNRGGLGNGADGLTFTLQTNANNVGGSGGGLGYLGINNSMAVEFDTYDNVETGGSNHVGVDLNGSVNSVASTGLLTPDFDDGSIWYAWIDYNGASDDLEVRWSQSLLRPISSMLSYNVDLPSILGSTDVYAGFTAATGAGWGEHNILSWTFENEFNPIGQPVPEPSTYLLMLVGLGGLVAVARRRSRAA
jgi:hypothetical protein